MPSMRLQLESRRAAVTARHGPGRKLGRQFGGARPAHKGLVVARRFQVRAPRGPSAAWRGGGGGGAGDPSRNDTARLELCSNRAVVVLLLASARVDRRQERLQDEREDGQGEQGNGGHHVSLRFPCSFRSARSAPRSWTKDFFDREPRS